MLSGNVHYLEQSNPITTERSLRHIDVIIIGTGHAGLAVSQRLCKQSVDHVVFDAGDVEAQLSATDGGDVAAGATADDDEIEGVRVGHGCLSK